MKTGTVKFIKETAVQLELGIDFQANDLEEFSNGLKRVKNEVLNEIAYKNFTSCPRVTWTGFFDKETKTFRMTVTEDLFI